MNHSVQPPLEKWGEGVAGSSVLTDQQIQHTYRKVAFRLVPFLFLCWVVNYLDRVNLGFAKMSLSQDLALSDAAYGLGVGLFSIGYVLFEVPSNLMLEKIGARLTMTRIMVLWGVVTCSMMFIHNTTQFYIARIVLGAAEAGFYPGLLLYLTYWFPSARRARITSRFLLSIAVSGIIGGPIAGWILHSFNNVAGLRDWQWLFLLEGLPAVLLGVIAYFYLDDRPKDAKWLTETERQFLIDNIQADRKFKGSAGHQGLLAVLRDPRVYVVVLASLVTPMLGIVMNYWTPTIIHRAGVKDILHVALLSAIPSISGNRDGSDRSPFRQTRGKTLALLLLDFDRSSGPRTAAPGGRQPRADDRMPLATRHRLLRRQYDVLDDSTSVFLGRIGRCGYRVDEQPGTGGVAPHTNLARMADDEYPQHCDRPVHHRGNRAGWRCGHSGRRAGRCAAGTSGHFNLIIIPAPGIS
ncbi:MFS transporter [Paraburkholderia kirstenboschensis]|uniref:MFS transporter n=1 Tax=Paraburkholderia kirstenboschensis TaxID=1245436 RepID=UPI000B062FF6